MNLTHASLTLTRALTPGAYPYLTLYRRVVALVGLYLAQLEGLPAHQAHGTLGTEACGIDHAPLDEQVLG